MKLLLLRHAESYGNATGNYSIAESDSLSDRGKEQAEAIVDELAVWEFSRIVVSPFKRAQDTIAPYLKSCGRQAEIWPEIAEACWHDERDGAPSPCDYVPASVASSVPDQFCFRDNRAVTPARPETYGMGLYRALETTKLLESLTVSEDGVILMGTHGHFIREILNFLLNPQPYEEFHHDNCGMTCLTYDGVWSLDFCNRGGR